MGLTISQTNAQIGIDRTPSFMEIRSTNAKLELHQKQARINIHTEQVKVEIDQYEARASAGMKNNFDFLKDAAVRGYQQAIEFIGKKAADGDTLAAIERGGNPIADIAERDAYPEHEFGYDYIPKVGPTFNVTGSVTFDPEPNGQGIHNGVEGNYIPGDLSINYTPAKVEIYLKQYASINFRYEPDNKIDAYI